MCFNINPISRSAEPAARPEFTAFFTRFNKTPLAEEVWHRYRDFALEYFPDLKAVDFVCDNPGMCMLERRSQFAFFGMNGFFNLKERIREVRLIVRFVSREEDRAMEVLIPY